MERSNPVDRNGGSAALCLVAVVVLFTILVSVLVGIAGLHRVPEGHVGVYWFGGALSDATTAPGFHWAMPFVTQ